MKQNYRSIILNGIPLRNVGLLQRWLGGADAGTLFRTLSDPSSLNHRHDMFHLKHQDEKTKDKQH